MRRKKNIDKQKPIGILLLAILFLSTGLSAFSQESVKDSIQVVETKAIHSARKATIYSAVLPGLGQIYNRKYWKVPLVWGGFATLGYFINFNNDLYTTYKQAYSDIIDNDPLTNSHLDLKVNPLLLLPERKANFIEVLRGAKDGTRRNRDLVVISTVAFYAITIIDASVDAHFFNFDIGEDLTFNWSPGQMMCLDNKTIGIHCRFTF
jgi:hypothetical protein